MIGDIVYPPIEAVRQAQEILIDRYGGASGLRSEDGLRAAMERGEQLRAYGEAQPDMFSVAAAVAYGFCRIHHPFVDGNKRIAFVVLFQILDLNGYFLDAAESDARDAILGIASGDMPEADFAAWVGAHALEVEP